jgi:hypothetical protein
VVEAGGHTRDEKVSLTGRNLEDGARRAARKVPACRPCLPPLMIYNFMRSTVFESAQGARVRLQKSDNRSEFQKFPTDVFCRRFDLAAESGRKTGRRVRKKAFKKD